VHQGGSIAKGITMATDSDLGQGDTDSSLTPDALAAFTHLQSDPTGSTTFERFVWQAKLAVRDWLSALSSGGPIAVVCEHVEDLVVVETNLFRFAQLKTRDRGSWSAAKICEPGHAVSALATSYLAAVNAGIVGSSQFEVWLEGPSSETADTVAFFTDPNKATEAIKKKIRAMGLKGNGLADFLSRLQVHCQQPSRETVDAVVMRTIGAAWPSLTFEQIEQLYERLLQAATAAQTASEPPPTVRAALQAAQQDPADNNRWDPIRAQALTSAQIQGLCPPLTSETNEQLFDRAAAGQASLLELKLVRAGASKSTIEQAIRARADAEVAATLVRAAGTVDDEAIQSLDERILSMAGSVATLAALGWPSGGSAAQPAEHIYHNLMSRPADVVATDADRVFSGDHRLVVGHLCHVSDQCRFSWGVS